jgi:hypothetical protein
MRERVANIVHGESWLGDWLGFFTIRRVAPAT